MSYCTVEDVKKLTRAKAKSFGYKDDENKFDELIQDWITQAESLINSECRREWKPPEQVPLAVKNVCLRLTSNIIAFYYARRDDPVKKVNDFSVKIFSSEVFTEDLRQDLKPFRKTKKAKVFGI